jgi:hypothetical protein
MYLMARLGERGHNAVVGRAIRKAGDREQAHRIIADELPVFASIVRPAQLEEIGEHISQMPTSGAHPGLTRRDWQGTFGVYANPAVVSGCRSNKQCGGNGDNASTNQNPECCELHQTPPLFGQIGLTVALSIVLSHSKRCVSIAAPIVRFARTADQSFVAHISIQREYEPVSSVLHTSSVSQALLKNK